MISCNNITKKLNKYYDKIKNSHDVEYIIFYMNTEYCPYSNNAIKLLKQYKKSFKGYCVKDPSKNIDKKQDLINCLKNTSKYTGFDNSYNTLPIIFHNGKFIGGYDQLKSYIN